MLGNLGHGSFDLDGLGHGEGCQGDDGDLRGEYGLWDGDGLHNGR